MITTTITTPAAPAVYPESNTWHGWRARLSWGSILAGCFAALAMHIVLAMLGLSLGVAVINPKPYQHDLPAISIAVGLGWSISALISLWIGGWIAGRTAPRGPGNSGGIHGVLVWCVATVVAVAFVTGGGGMAIGGAMRAMGGGMSRAMDAVAAQTGPGFRGMDYASPSGLMNSFLDEAARQPGSRELAPGEIARARREAGTALARFFTQKDASARDSLVTAVANYSGRSRTDAEEIVRSWETTYTRAVEEAEVAATKAAKKAAAFAAWMFLAFCVGAFFAAWGGRCGGCRYNKLYVIDPYPYPYGTLPHDKTKVVAPPASVPPPGSRPIDPTTGI